MNPIGIIQCQGGHDLFEKTLSRLQIPYVIIRHQDDFKGLGGLILHGGESTAQYLLFKKQGYIPKIKQLAHENKPVLGVCAGCILLSDYQSEAVNGLALLNMTVERNFYGRQINSQLVNSDEGNEVLFIRAPHIKTVEPAIDVLQSFNGYPILVRQNNCYGASFHPEALQNDFSDHLFRTIFS